MRHALSTGTRRLLLLGSLAAALAGAEWLILHGAAYPREPWWVWSLFPLFLFTAAASFDRTARILSGAERMLWLCFSLACFLYGAGESVWGVYDVLGTDPDPFPAPAYLAYYSFGALLILGFWYCGQGMRSMDFTLLQLGNLGILVSTIVLGYLLIFHRFLDAPVPFSVSLISIGYCVLTLSAFLFGLIAVGLRTSGPLRRIMLLVVAGVGMIAINDYHFTYVLLNASYVKTDPLNGVYLLACSLFVWACFERNALHRKGEGEPLSPELEERAKRWETLLLPISVASVLLIAFLFRERLSLELVPYVAGASVLFVISLALRSWWGHQVEMRLRDQALASQAQLELANLELRHEMQRRARAQEQLRQSQKMEALGQLTGGVAHDFNNLLAVILGNLEMLDQPERLGDSRRAFVQEAIDAANRGAALTQRLLALSRKQALSPEPIELPALLESMRDLLARTLGERIRVEISQSEPVWRCVADRAQLESVLLNLAINARDAMPDGGVLAIRIYNLELGEAEVAERPEAKAGAYVVISVRDTGMGIPADLLDRVFDPFFTTKDVGAGTGLGLSMAYGFAKQSGGHITIDSQLGRGTELRLYLPRTERPGRQSEGEEASEMPAGRSESLLVVEDEPAVRRFVVTLLEGLGYAVRAVPDGEAALAALQEMERIDLLLSDVVLPGSISGPRLAQEVSRRRPEAKIVLMSGYAEEVRSSEAADWPDEDLLHKPFRKAELAHRIRAALDA